MLSWPACVRTVQFTGASDVEAPEFDVGAHSASVGRSDACETLSLNIPIHVRAPTPGRLAPLRRPAPRGFG